MLSLKDIRAGRRLAAALAGAALTLCPFACGDPPGEDVVEPTCEERGGIVLDGGPDAGECVAVCDPAKCKQGEGFTNTCYANACRLVCSDHDACGADGSMACVPVVDDAGQSVNVCLPHGFQAGYSDPAAGTWGGWYGAPCPLLNECDAEAGFLCVSRIGDNTGTSKKDDGKYDPDNYCAKADCQSDADCPGGYECSVIRDLHPICGKEGDKVYSKSTLPCVDPAEFTASGKTFQEGPGGLLRNVCMKRTVCSPCWTDLDCSRDNTLDLRCTLDAEGAGFCAKGCGTTSAGDPDQTTCPRDYECVDLSGDGTDLRCIPRFGTCKGAGQFCEPCRHDLDCGPPDTRNMCLHLNMQKERACFDLGYPHACPGGQHTECPTSPSNDHGFCNSNTSSPNYHKCELPYKLTGGQPDYATCWVP